MPTVPLLTLAIIILCVTIHYEMLVRLVPWLERMTVHTRQRVVFAVLVALAAHVIEIWIFAGGYYYALGEPSVGEFIGEVPMEDFWDCLYLSFVVYSTLGFGDIVPQGWIRFMVGTEAITGLVQIAWTASFLYYEIQQDWGDPPSLITGRATSGRDSTPGSSRR
jgi:hypothetical protein